MFEYIKKHRRSWVFLLLFLSPCSLALADAIDFTEVPPYGTAGDLSGQTSGIVYDDYQVLVYIYVSGWWNKPTWASPLTAIDSDGSWTCNITTGGESDTFATRIIAFLVPNGSYLSSWEIAGQADLPPELYAYPYAEISRQPANRAIRFARHNWAVKTGDNLGPGPNHFSDGEDNVWVDENGCLHLKITKVSGQWYCGEVVSDESFGYGTYVFTVASNVDNLDRNVVLGLFTWDTYAPQYNYREIDFEFSRWQDPANAVGQYVIQPWDHSGNLFRFDINYTGPDDITTHVMTWRPDGIYFKSYYGTFSLAPPPASEIMDWYYTGPDNPPPGGENARMNLWLINGSAPADGQETEVIISDFQFLSGISDQPADINDDTAVNLADFAQIAARWQGNDCDIYTTWCREADLTCNGTVNTEDLFAFLTYWMDSLD
jgi:hypothetical protein